MKKIMYNEPIHFLNSLTARFLCFKLSQLVLRKYQVLTVNEHQLSYKLEGDNKNANTCNCYCNICIVIFIVE